MSRIKTKIGTLVTDQLGVEGDYPGIAICLEKENGETIYGIVVVEYDEVKGKLQCVVYNNPNDTDSPSDIIELDNIMKDIKE